RFDYLKVLALIEIDALTGRAEHDVARNAGLIPLREIRSQTIEVDFFTGGEGCRYRQQYAAQINCHESLFGAVARLLGRAQFLTRVRIQERDYNQQFSDRQFA